MVRSISAEVEVILLKAERRGEKARNGESDTVAAPMGPLFRRFKAMTEKSRKKTLKPRVHRSSSSDWNELNG